jgi:hypothetical protein
LLIIDVDVEILFGINPGGEIAEVIETKDDFSEFDG